MQVTQNKFLIVLFPHKQPGGLNVTFPLPLTVTVQLVGQVFLWQLAFGGKYADGLAQQFHIITATLAHLHLAFEFACKSDGVHTSTQDIV